MGYDTIYSESNYVFGSEPEKILVDFTERIEKTIPVLDIGAGQGRNSFFLAERGFKVDAIDPSSVAVNTINKIGAEKDYNITAYQSDFQDWNPQMYYSAVLIFGLIQILDWKSIDLLIDKIDLWTINESLIFITAFSIKDPSIQKYSNEWNTAGKNSFTNGKDEFRTFLGEHEILKLFENYKVLHHWEGSGKKHRHGDGPVEQHSMIELVIQK